MTPGPYTEGFTKVSTTLRKPMGIVFEEAAKGGGGGLEVVELVPGGNAEKSGAVQVGDILNRCSAVVLKAGKEGKYETEGYGQRPYDNWDRIMFDCAGQTFDDVMAALGSNNERWGFFDITVELLRPDAATTANNDDDKNNGCRARVHTDDSTRDPGVAGAEHM